MKYDYRYSKHLCFENTFSFQNPATLRETPLKCSIDTSAPFLIVQFKERKGTVIRWEEVDLEIFVCLCHFYIENELILSRIVTVSPA